MGTDEQVRHYSEARGSPLATKLTPQLPGLRSGVIENRFESNTEKLHRLGKLRIRLEVCANLSPYDLARHQRSGVVCSAQRFARTLAMNRVSAQNIQQNG